MAIIGLIIVVLGMAVIAYSSVKEHVLAAPGFIWGIILVVLGLLLAIHGLPWS